MPVSIDSQLAPEALLRGLVPDLGKARRAALAPLAPSTAPLAGHCGEMPAEGSFCWKLVNPDPEARYDFWLLLTMRRLGPAAMTVSLVVPLDDGGLLHCIDTPLYEKAVSTTLVQKLKQEHGSFGPVSIAKLKVRVIYEESQRVLFGNRFLSARYGAQGRMVEPYREAAGLPFPPLPQGSLDRQGGAERRRLAVEARGVSVKAALAQLDLPDTEPLLSVHYPDYTVGADGEIEVEEGIVEGAEDDPAFALAATASGGGDLLRSGRPPGLYIDVTHREHPPLNLAVYSLQPVDGPGRILFADYCTGQSSHELSVSITVKRKRSFFKKKKKITVIRKELQKETFVCGTLYDGGLTNGVEP